MPTKTKLRLGILSGALCISIFTFAICLNKAYRLKKETSFYPVPYAYLNILPENLKSLAADVFLIRGILYAGDVERHCLSCSLENLRLAARLNPRLTYAYILGGITAPHGSEELPAGIQFLEEGLKKYPQKWEFAFWIGFNYLQLGDNLKGAEYYRLASNMPESPNYLKSMAARHYYEGGESNTALLYLEGIHSSVNDPKLLRNIEVKISWLRNIVALEEKCVLFRNKYGYWPDDLEELLREGFIKEIPEDPFARGYYIEKENNPRYGRVKSRF